MRNFHTRPLDFTLRAGRGPFGVLGGGVSRSDRYFPGSLLAALLEVGWWEGRERSRKSREEAATRIPALTGTAAVAAGELAHFWMYVEGRADRFSDGLLVRSRRKSASN